MISIGADYGGPELEGSPIKKAISAAMGIAIKLRSPFEIGDSPGVNVVFYVPGRLTSPDWRGSRDGKFSRKKQFLMIQVAVPADVVTSSHIKEFVIDSLHAANALAFKVFHKKGIEFALADADALVDRIEAEMNSSRL